MLLLVGIVVVAAALLATAPQPQVALQEATPLRVEVVEVARRDLRPATQVSGTLQPAQRATLRFEVTGRVAERLVEPGQAMAAGAPLLRLADDDYRDAAIEARARWRQEQAAVERDRQLLALAEQNSRLQVAEVERQERLGQESLASRTALDAARQRLFQLQAEEEQLRFNVATAQSRLDLQRSALNRAERNLARSALTAPFEGLVNAVWLEVGDYVAANQDALELVRIDTLDLYAEVDGRVAAELTLGMAVQVSAGQQQLAGSVIALQQQPDQATYTHALRVRVADAAVMPGTLAEVSLPLPAELGVAVIPVTAVVRDDGQAYAFVVVDGRAQRRQVQLGVRDGQWQAVLAGVEVGEVIVARDVAALADGVGVEF